MAPPHPARTSAGILVRIVALQGTSGPRQPGPGRHPLQNPTENLEQIPPKTPTQMMMFGPQQQVRMLPSCRGLRMQLDAHLGTTETPCRLCIPNPLGQSSFPPCFPQQTYKLPVHGFSQLLKHTPAPS